MKTVGIVLLTFLSFSVVYTYFRSVPLPENLDWLLKRSKPPFCGGTNNKWYRCQKDSDCVVFRNECGHKTAFNSKFLNKIQNYNKCIAPHIDCVSLKFDRNKGKTKSHCKNNKCLIVN